METLLDTPEEEMLYGWYYRASTENYEFWWGNLVYIHIPAIMLDGMPEFLAMEIRAATTAKPDLVD